MADKVAVLGAGSWGTALGSIIARRIPTTLWARSKELALRIESHKDNPSYLPGHLLPPQLVATADLEEAVDGASIVIVAVPSRGVRSVLEGLPFGPPINVPVLSVTKGIEAGSLLTMTAVIEQCWPGHAVGVLCGPNLAGEVLIGEPSASVVAFADLNVATVMQEIFTTESWRIYTNSDVMGCEISGAVKNVLAIASGMAVGLGLGANTQAALITRSLAEMTRLGVATGGNPVTFSGLAGLGDLVATCTSPLSRNRQVGIELAKGNALVDVLNKMSMVAEGVGSARAVIGLAERHGVEMPVAEQVVAVCFEGLSPSQTIPLLMGRAPRHENHSTSREQGRR